MSKNRSDARGQHHVPCMLQRNFGTPGNGKKIQVNVFDKQNDRTFRTSPENILQERDFNTFEFGGVTYCLEDGFGKIEDQAAPVLRKIIASRSISGLTSEEREALIVFNALQQIRGVSLRATMADIIEQVREMVRSQGQDPDTVPQLRVADAEQVKLTALNFVSNNLSKLTESYFNKRIILLEAAPQRDFLLGDTPVVLANHNDTGPYGNLGLEVPGIEIYMPISPDFVIAFWCPSIIELMRNALRQTETNIRKNAPIVLFGVGPDADRVRSLHPQLIENAAKIKCDLNAIEEQRAVISAPDHMDYLNSLQVKYAERYIVSGSGDFSLAKRMLSDNQNFRGGMRAKIG